MNEKENLSFITDYQEDDRDEYLAKWEIILLTTIFIITVFGNSLVLFSIYLRRYRARKKLTRMYFFIMNLSIADLLTGLLDVLPQLAWDITFRFQGGPVLCKLVKFFQPFGPYLSSYILTATAIDRYHAICHPLSYCSVTSRKSRIMVYWAWSIAFILCIPQLFVFSYQEITPGIWDCWATFDIKFGERAYVTWYSLMVFLLPFIVLVYTYVGICIGVWQSNKMSGAVDDRTYIRSVSGFARNRSSFISKAMINTVKQTISVITLYVITSIPFIGCELWATWDPEASKSSFVTGPTFTILALLNSLTSCVNPWIYLSFNQELRLMLMNYFCNRHEYYGHGIIRCSNSNDTSTRTSLMSRISRYAGSVIFR
ncbi:cephalotocin receptor 1-like [Vespa crabro]|uniref:cephalotocin receptor 1-like n=1 Tax=Vespa crabro TaxID=7445 RepID=UPI001F02F32E|nr:cephalotocin receptor 1-like [Vespa crabro]